MKRRTILALLFLLVVAGVAQAHEARPGYLDLREADDGSWSVLWKQPARGEMRLRLDPVFPAGCSVEGAADQQLVGGAFITRTRLVCEGGLAGKTIYINGLEATLTDVLIRIHHTNGTEESYLVKPEDPKATIEGSQSTGRRAAVYLVLGIEHILGGIDHLLFVLGLLLLVKDRWMLLKTVTSFTLAHSITLAMATLGYASVHVPTVEAVIALSILFLGPEILRYQRGETSLTIRHPWVVAFAFGLLHGFGFATALGNIGVPESEVPMALLLFNVGVEIGQIMFVLVVILVEKILERTKIVWPSWVEAIPAYAVGSIGAFWAIQRTAVVFGFGV